MNANEEQQTSTGTTTLLTEATASASGSGNANPVEVVAVPVAVVQDELLIAPTTEQLNMRCTGVKRLMKEAVELREPNEMFCAKPLEDNLFEWHFTVRGPPDTVYSNGVYHGRIVLPADYPMKPPNLILMTPNGRFETNKKICLSISGYHPETWLPSWSIRTALLALIGFMPTHSAGALGGLECSQEERCRLALKSLDWSCPQCNVCMRNALPPIGSSGITERLMVEVKSAIVPSSPAIENGSNSNGAKTETATNVIASPSQSSSIQDVPSPTHRHPTSSATTPANNSTTQQHSSSIRQPASAFRAFLESPLLWMSILFMLFLALLFRRLLSNHNSNLQQAQER